MFFKVAWPLIKWLSNGNNRWCKTTFMITPLSLDAAAAAEIENPPAPFFVFIHTLRWLFNWYKTKQFLCMHQPELLRETANLIKPPDMDLWTLGKNGVIF